MITLVPAYGRDYKFREALLADWEAGKDFRIVDGPYTSIRDEQILRDQYGGIMFRYAKLAKVFIL